MQTNRRVSTSIIVISKWKVNSLTCHGTVWENYDFKYNFTLVNGIILKGIRDV